MPDLRERAAELLEQIPAGEPLGTRLFEAVAQLTPITALEAVALRRREGHIEVFMTQRGPDEAYPDQIHAPGSIFRNGELPKNVLTRLEKSEFHVPVKSFRQVDDVWHQEVRGWMHSLIFLVELEQDPPVGAWVHVEQLPKGTVTQHAEFIIPRAVQAFIAGL